MTYLFDDDPNWENSLRALMSHANACVSWELKYKIRKDDVVFLINGKIFMECRKGRDAVKLANFFYQYNSAINNSKFN